MLHELRGDTFEECKKLKTKSDSDDFQLLKFVRRGETIYVDNTDTVHIRINDEITSTVPESEAIQDAGYLKITNGVMEIMGISDTIPFFYEDWQRDETEKLLSTSLKDKIDVRKRG